MSHVASFIMFSFCFPRRDYKPQYEKFRKEKEQEILKERERDIQRLKADVGEEAAGGKSCITLELL